MRLYLINPHNPLVSLASATDSRWNRYRVWKPLGLLVLAGLTGPDWDVTVIDENVHGHDYAAMARPDLVGITAFTSQAPRAYELADRFRRLGVPVVMGGIHATMRTDEALEHVDAVVTGEAEELWTDVLDDARTGRLRHVYHGSPVDMAIVPKARHDLLPKGYAFGSVQTTRGCPLNCSFCSVSSFNGKRYRQRPIPDVIEEMKTIRERLVLVVDDNLIGTTRAHVGRAKELFRAMINAKLRKRLICQVTINIADDEELLTLARRAGVTGMFIGFESTNEAGLAEIGKKFNAAGGRDFAASVRRIQRHGILVVGSFIMGLDADGPGIGLQIAETAGRYGVDLVNTLILTPLPGTRLWDEMLAEDRITADDFPDDWRLYTLGFPTAEYRRFSASGIVEELQVSDRAFYSLRRMVRRTLGALLRRRHPLVAMVANFSYWKNARVMGAIYESMGLARPRPATGLPALLAWLRTRWPFRRPAPTAGR